MQRFLEIPVLLASHPEIDVTLALKATASMWAGDPVAFKRAIRVDQRSGVIIENGPGIELGWISGPSVERLVAYLTHYGVAAVSFYQPLNFGCMIRASLVERAQLSTEGLAPDIALRKICAALD